MRRFALGLALLLAGCGSAEQGARETTTSYDVAEPAAPTPDAAQKEGTGAQPLAVTLPRIAYAYRYAFVLPGDAVAKAQAAHVALCDKLGPARCQLLQMKTTSGEDQVSAATLKLRVASADARRFGAAAIAAVGKAGGRTVDQDVEAEDVSKQMVDAAARIRQRELLVQRLTEILRTRTGKVAELVEAERSVATAQEELDAARGWLAELSGRVAYSTMALSYAAVTATSSRSLPGELGEAVAVSLSTFSAGLRGLLTLAIILAPWAVLVGLAVWGIRAWRRRRAGPPPPADD